MTDGDRKRILDTACNVLATALPAAWAVYVYGSFARGDEWPKSDVDLAVLLAPGAGIPDKLTLTGEISRHVGRDVDPVNLRRGQSRSGARAVEGGSSTACAP